MQKQFIQTIKIIRKAEDNLNTIIIQEFFELVGCIVEDELFTAGEQLEVMKYESLYDIVIILGIQDKKRSLSCNSQKNGQNGISKNNDTKTYVIYVDSADELLDNIIKSNHTSKEVKKISEKFKDKKFPIILNHMKYLLFAKRHNFQYVLRICNKNYKKIIDVLTELFNFIDRIETEADDMYFLYSTLKIPYMINCAHKLMEDTHIFDFVQVHERAVLYSKTYPDFISIYTIMANMCIEENKLILNTTTHFKMALSKMHNLHFPKYSSNHVYFEMTCFLESRLPFLKSLLSKKDIQNMYEELYWKHSLRVPELCLKISAKPQELMSHIQNMQQNRNIEDLLPKERCILMNLHMKLVKLLLNSYNHNLALKLAQNMIALTEVEYSFEKELNGAGVDFSKTNAMNTYMLMIAYKFLHEIFSECTTDIETILKYQNLYFSKLKEYESS